VKSRGILALLVVALVLALQAPQAAAAQQTGTITGQVVDVATGQPMSGVEVFIPDTQLGTLTRENGRFLLQNVPAGNHRVSTSFIGYAPETRANVTVRAGETTEANFQIRTDALQLERVVATGVIDPTEGIRLPFVVSKLSGENLTTVPTTQSALAALQGKVAGVQVIRAGGQPGTGVYIELRTPTTILGGSGSPLYVVDGVILGSGTQDIETLDIESIEIIKGAAGASLYGSQGAAGVVAITTRRGRDLGVGVTRMQTRTEYGFSELPPNRPSLAQHHAFLQNEQGQWIDHDGNVVERSGRVMDPRGIADNPYLVPTYDNLAALFQPGRYVTNNFSISQNFEQTNYTVSFNALDEKGAVAGNEGYQRYNGRVNLDHRFTDNLQLSLTGYHSRSHRDDLSGSPFSTLLYYDPTINLAAKDENGNYYQFPDPTVLSENPIWRQATRENWQQRETTQSNIRLTYRPISWLRAVGMYSYDRTHIRNQIYVPKGVPQAPFEENPTDGRLYYTQDGRDNHNASLMFTMNQTFGQFNPRLTVGSTMEKFDRLYFNVDGRDFAIKDLKNIDLAIDKSRMNSLLQQERAAGFLADLALDYAGKYIGSFVVRRDGSSRFGPDNRWGTYHAIRGAYRMAEEPWWPFGDVITEFKPRVAVGTSGGRPTYTQQFETWGVSIGSDGVVTFSRGNAGNFMLAPEITFEREIGVDFYLFDNHEFRLTWVEQTTDDLILQGVGPAAEGYFSRWENIGAQSGTTFEAEYTSRLITTPNLRWNLTLVGDRSNSWISRWDRPAYPSGFRQMGLEGTLYDIWGRYVLTNPADLNDHMGGIPEEFHNQFQVNDDGYLVWVGEGNSWQDGIAKGLWGTSGSVAGRTYQWGMPFEMRDPDGNIDRRKIGSSMPDFNFGIMNMVHAGNFSVFAHLRGQIGGAIYEDVRQSLYHGGRLRHADVDQAGKPDERKKPTNYYSSALYQGYAYASPFVADATFMKVQAMNVSYRFNQSTLQTLFRGMAPAGLTLGLNGRNLWTFTGYDGWDPDVGSPAGRIDSANNYPNMRQWTLMAEVTF
jgi:TonB-linked SusC/RagA family outer membrane protein